jgi:cytidylate kinase
MLVCVLLSGPVAGGKSAVARELVERHGFQSIRSGAYLASLASRRGLGTSRTILQRLGDELDQETDYRWLIDDVAVPALETTSDRSHWLLDSVRKRRQVEHFRARFQRSVLHAHLTAPEQILRARYVSRMAAGAEYTGNTAYETAIAHPNEISARSLIDIADIVLDASVMSARDAATAIVERASLGANYAPNRSD